MKNFFPQIFLAFLILAVLVVLNIAGFLEPALDQGRVGLAVLVDPIVTFLQSIKNFTVFIAKLQEVFEQDAILTGRVEKLTSEVALLEKFREENRILRETLGFRRQVNYEIIGAEIIGVDNLTIKQKMFLDKGQNQGIAKGQAVLSPSGVLVGIIDKVSADTSSVLLLASSQATVNAEVSQSQILGLVRGEHGLSLIFELVPREAPLKTGDLVVTSGLGGRLPKNLLIGRINKVESGEGELFQKATIIPAANYSALRFVLIVQ